MQLDVFALRHDFQILGGIVMDVSVDVMNNLAGFESASNLLFSNKSVGVPSKGLFVRPSFAFSFTRYTKFCAHFRCHSCGVEFLVDSGHVARLRAVIGDVLVAFGVLGF